MKIKYLVIFLIFAMFAPQSWAPPIKGSSGSTASSDISKCDLDPAKQTKVFLRDGSGKEIHVCTGQAICAGKIVPISCKVSDREKCPVSKQCISFDDLFDLPGDGWVKIVKCLPVPDDGYYRLNKTYKFKAKEKVGGRWVPANNLEWTFGGAPFKEIWRSPDSIKVKFTLADSKVLAKVKSKESKKEYFCSFHSVK